MPAVPSNLPFIFAPSAINVGVNELCADSGVTPGVPAIGCPGISYVDPAFRNPRVQNLTLGVEHQLGGGWSANANYVFMHSDRLKTGGFSTSVWSRNLVSVGTDQFGRAIIPEITAVTPCPAGGLLFPGTPVPLDCSLTQFTGANELGSFSRGNYHEVVIGANKRFSHRYQFFANYTWSRNFSNDSSERDTDTSSGHRIRLTSTLTTAGTDWISRISSRLPSWLIYLGALTCRAIYLPQWLGLPGLSRRT